MPIFVHPYIPAGSERMQDYYLHNLVGVGAETGIGQRIPGEPVPSAGEGNIIAFPVLGGLHYNYRRAA